MADDWRNPKMKDKFKGIISEDEFRRLIMPVDTNIDFSKVILSQENKDKYDKFITEHNFADKLIAHNLRPMNRLLLYGASGTGKTFSSKALANLLHYDMLYVDIANALANGEVAQNLKKVFALGNTGECLVMLDECDSLAVSRDSKTAENGDMRRALNSLFQLMDQSNPKIIIIAATNMLHRLDPAFERRFDMKLEFRRPDLNIKQVINKFKFPEFEFVDDVDDTTDFIVNNRAKQYTKMSYYELQGIVERAMKKAIIRGDTKLLASDVYSELKITLKIKDRFCTNVDLDQPLPDERESQ
jgi:SpoVK/Ycf46/Vps4 family AAA+-type ATPase